MTEGDIVFVDHLKYYDACLNSAATFIIINKKTEAPAGKTLFIVEDPFEAYQKIVRHFSPFASSEKMISDTAKIGKNTVIMPNVFLGSSRGEVYLRFRYTILGVEVVEAAGIEPASKGCDQ